MRGVSQLAHFLESRKKIERVSHLFGCFAKDNETRKIFVRSCVTQLDEPQRQAELCGERGHRFSKVGRLQGINLRVDEAVNHPNGLVRSESS